MEARTLKRTPKETKHHSCGAKLQGLPNLIRKKNVKRQLKQT
jgi:ribosomal protein L34E